MKRALITGITGQDGSYLAELLLGKGYEVHGLLRRASLFNTDRVDHLYHDPHESGARFTLHYGDLADGTGLRRVLERVQPDEIYNLAAQSHVKVSFEMPEYTADIVALGTLRLLEAVRDHIAHRGSPVRVYQAGSSEMYGAAPARQSEATPFYPRSPYAASKVAAHYYAINYREAWGMFVCNGILFNHESPRRGETFVTRKITRAVGRIKEGLQDKPDDYVVSTGTSYTVQQFVELAFAELGLDWQKHVEIDPRYFRPTEVDHLEGENAKACRMLGWEPKVTLPELVKMMVQSDHSLAKQESLLSSAGHTTPLRGAAHG